MRKSYFLKHWMELQNTKTQNSLIANLFKSPTGITFSINIEDVADSKLQLSNSCSVPAL